MDKIKLDPAEKKVKAKFNEKKRGKKKKRKKEESALENKAES